ncbi:glycoside hydrolase family 140 protein [Occultella kanbiaonis]|uniref:glycoside hydrolase family 140 protein n=1 Tax=Occultella kanbiaonis TaxID=2675754 RepID=UPI0012B8855E|nr:glycoside hydrolase family 140 protein [Occultella kanbiaonis]
MKVEQPWQHGRIEPSADGHYFQHEDGAPFFWQADTVWLLLTRLSLDEAEEYFADRHAKGYNVAQVMVIHSPASATLEGRLPFIDEDVTRPDTRPADPRAGLPGPSFWDHLDDVLKLAARWGIYLALVPIWGSNVEHGDHSDESVATYGTWLARRYRHHPNIVWLNGGDLRGTTRMPAWRSLGEALRKNDPTSPITFHPFGRCQSSTWFHTENWLDFNMFQSGHRDYEQVWNDDAATWKGPDNWRYVEQDYQRYPARPTVDGEPCYEEIPRGLHDPVHGYWGHDDSRRFAYWAVFAGAAGHTYGHNAVIQVHKPEYPPAYGVTMDWRDGLAAPGSRDLQHLRDLVLSYPYFERIPDQTVIVGDPGTREDRLVVTRGARFLLAYRFTGRPFELRGEVLPGAEVRMRWMDPITGAFVGETVLANEGNLRFTPPVGANGNTDMVLVLDVPGS